MIYNFVQLLKDNGITPITIEAVNIATPDEAYIVSESTGTPAPWCERTDYTVQIKTRSRELHTARKMAETAYPFVNRKFHATLPEYNNNGIIYPELTAAKLIPIQKPSYMGVDEKGLHVYVFNVEVTTN